MRLARKEYKAGHEGSDEGENTSAALPIGGAQDASAQVVATLAPESCLWQPLLLMGGAQRLA